MIAHIDITGINYTVDDSTRKYVMKKIGTLDRLAPRHARKTMRAEVKLAEVNRKNGNKHEVEVIVTVPGKHIAAKDSTVNALAAVDIVEQKLAAQLKKYKAQTVDHRPKDGLLMRLKRGLMNS